MARNRVLGLRVRAGRVDDQAQVHVLLARLDQPLARIEGTCQRHLGSIDDQLGGERGARIVRRGGAGGERQQQGGA
jgi:hypothetical protein